LLERPLSRETVAGQTGRKRNSTLFAVGEIVLAAVVLIAYVVFWPDSPRIIKVGVAALIVGDCILYLSFRFIGLTRRSLAWLRGAQVTKWLCLPLCFGWIFLYDWLGPK